MPGANEYIVAIWWPYEGGWGLPQKFYCFKDAWEEVKHCLRRGYGIDYPPSLNPCKPSKCSEIWLKVCRKEQFVMRQLVKEVQEVAQCNQP